MILQRVLARLELAGQISYYVGVGPTHNKNVYEQEPGKKPKLVKKCRSFREAWILEQELNDKANKKRREDKGISEEVSNAVEMWFEMHQSAKQVPIILASPLAAKFKKANAVRLYRGLVLKRNGELRAPKATTQIVAYTTIERLAHEFVDSLDISSPYIVVEKKYRPQDLVLNFAAFIKYLGQSGGWDEKELWMKPTPYYTTVSKKEIVYDSRNEKK